MAHVVHHIITDLEMKQLDATHTADILLIQTVSTRCARKTTLTLLKFLQVVHWKQVLILSEMSGTCKGKQIGGRTLVDSRIAMAY